MMQVIPMLLIAIVQAVSAFQYPCSNYVGHHHHDAGRRHTTLQSIEDPTLIEELSISGTIGLLANSIVERTGMANDLVKDEPTMDDSSESTSSLLLYGIADSIDDTAWVYFFLTLVAAVDTYFDIHYVDSDILKEAIPTIAVTVGIARTLSSIKRTLLLQRISGKKLGRTRIYDQFIDFILTFSTCGVILSELQLDDNVGMGFQSLFAISGASAVFFSLVSKDLAEHIVGGLAVQVWDAFSVGETITLGNGLSGKVVSIGLVETEIESSNNVITKIPNSKIVNERVSNISRATKSQVVQTLRFSYGDIKLVPKVLADIQEEIEASCPKLDRGTAQLKSYEADHIQTEVNYHFDIPPGNVVEYGSNREQVLLAIGRAIEKNNVTFAIPAINYVNTE
mmetsp:Transcript_11769/g.17538  ORF Transcript_11769/g.17538 Transcript_11769/m.17538 type:complete len:395 (+) Transcript_11769:50-1234(+)